MVRYQPVRLLGTDEEIVAVARHAWHRVAAQPDCRRVLPAVEQLGHQRRELMARLGAPPVTDVRTTPGASPQPATGRVRSVVLAVGLIGAIVSSALAGPTTKGTVLDPTIAVPALAAATAVAIVLLGVVLLTWPRRRTSSVEVLSMVIIVLVILAVVLGYRFVVGAGARATHLSRLQLWCWMAGAGLLVVELALLALAVRPGAGRSAPSGGADARAQGRWLRARATRLARSGCARDGWEAEIHEMATVPLATREQAGRLGPVAWLVWTFYDGTVDVSAVVRSH